MKQASRGTNRVRVSNNNWKPRFSILSRALPFSASAVKVKRIFLLIFTLLFAFSNIAFAADKVNVYYFYGKPRCTTCMKIENYTKSAVASMKDKDIVFKGVDMDNTANGAMVKKYNLYTKSVIISKVKNGKEQWKNLDKIWIKVSNEQIFKNYVITEIKNLKGAK